MEEPKSAWGGRREGSGRKATGRTRKPRSIAATDEEWSRLKEMAKSEGKDISSFVLDSILKRK